MTARDPLATAIRDRLARPVVAIYAALLVSGLVMYSVTAGEWNKWLWIGAIAGTVGGFVFALRNARLWVTALAVAAVVYIGEAFSLHASSPDMWEVFVPAALCAYASLSDRWSLAACWFPIVLWMLSILDHTHSTLQIDRTSIALLACAAFGAVALLRARESRRVALWTKVSAAPLATVARPELMQEAMSAPVIRAAWTATAAALAIAATAWIAPKLWRLESASWREQVVSAAQTAASGGLPCCPSSHAQSHQRTRVREFLDLGRGAHSGDDDVLGATEPMACRACPADVDLDVEGELAACYQTIRETGAVSTLCDAMLTLHDPYYGPHARGADVVVNGGGAGGVAVGGVGGGGRGVGGVGHVDGVGGGGAGGYGAHTWSPTQTPTPTPSASWDQPDSPPIPAPVPHFAPVPPSSYLPHVDAPSQLAPRPPVAHTPPPAIASPPAAIAPRTSSVVSIAPTHSPSDPRGSLERILIALAVAFVTYRVATLVLRPLRRSLTLRHLRHPFWTETVDQQVSNSWQLALIGLRDGGWRSSAAETPQELARRVGIAELASCATILERARYGVQLDADDVATMTASADAVYAAARAKLGPAARTVATLRWPLI